MVDNALKWSVYGSADTLVTGANLNALADAAGVVGAEIDNSADAKDTMDIWFSVDTDRTSVGTDARLDFYLIAAPNGTNYPDPPGSTALDTPGSYHIGSMLSAKRDGTVTNFTSGWLFNIPIPPAKFKVVVVNELGTALPSNNNSVCSGYRYHKNLVTP